MKEHDICAGVMQVMKDFIIEAVDEAWLEELEDDLLGFMNVTPIEMLQHLEKCGGTLDFIET